MSAFGGWLLDAGAHLFVWKLLLRLESFIEKCPVYEHAWHQRVAVVLCYNTLFAYVYFGTQSVAFRWLRFAVLWAGLGLLGVELMLVNSFTAPLRQGPAACSTDDSVRLSEEAAVIMYFSVFYWLHSVVFHKGPWQFTGRLLVLLLVWGSSLWSLLHLELHAPTAIVAGVAAGVTGALFTFAVFHWLYLNRDLERVRLWLRRLRVHSAEQETMPLVDLRLTSEL